MIRKIASVMMVLLLVFVVVPVPGAMAFVTPGGGSSYDGSSVWLYLASIDRTASVVFWGGIGLVAAEIVALTIWGPEWQQAYNEAMAKEALIKAGCVLQWDGSFKCGDSCSSGS